MAQNLLKNHRIPSHKLMYRHMYTQSVVINACVQPLIICTVHIEHTSVYAWMNEQARKRYVSLRVQRRKNGESFRLHTLRLVESFFDIISISLSSSAMYNNNKYTEKQTYGHTSSLSKEREREKNQWHMDTYTILLHIQTPSHRETHTCSV